MNERIPIGNIKQLNEKAGQFWFSKDTMRFFRSRLPLFAYKKGEQAYFVTSEVAGFSADAPRKYSIRVCDLNTGHITTVGEFHEYSRSEARAELKRVLACSTVS